MPKLHPPRASGFVTIKQAVGEAFEDLANRYHENRQRKHTRGVTQALDKWSRRQTKARQARRPRYD